MKSLIDVLRRNGHDKPREISKKQVESRLNEVERKITHGNQAVSDSQH